MANSQQLSLNNKNAKVWTNWHDNTERDFKSCIGAVFAAVQDKYPDHVFTHTGKVDNQLVLEQFQAYSPSHRAELNGSRGGGSNPDGGVISIQTKNMTKMPVFIGENKHQEDNPGNAIERSLKNISFFKNLLISENYFPYLLNINGPIVNERKGSLFDRITQDGGFMPVNQVFVCNDPERPRLRPFTVVLDQQFQFNKVFDMSMNIVDQSIQYLISTDRLCL